MAGFKDSIMSLVRRHFSLALLLAASLTTSAFGEDSLLPDLRLTPGKVAAGSRDRTGVSEAMMEKVFARYKIPRIRQVQFKIDHLIPLELGGADSIENLWPQNLSVRPYNPDRKKQLTRCLLVLISEGKITLAQAQKEMREDWVSSFVERLGMIYLR